MAPRDEETEPAVCLPCAPVNSVHCLWCLQDRNSRTSKTYSSPAGTRDEGDSQIRSEREKVWSTLISALLIAYVAVKLKHLDLISELRVPSFLHHL